jgi:hypothetical protein
MKKIMFGFFLMVCSHLNGQIVLEQVYPSSNFTKDLIVVNLGYDDYKYIVIDYYNDLIDIYNINHSPFMLGLTPPVSLDSGIISPGYFSRSLFDCDSSTIEYALWDPISLGSFYVYRTDGTLLFQKDSVLAPYCYGCYGASNEKKPIYNTSDGAKLWFLNQQSDYLIYDLCGELPVQVVPLENNLSAIKVYPNPTSGDINIECGERYGKDSYIISVFDSNMKLLSTQPIPNDGKVNMSLGSFQSGLYFFTIKSHFSILRTGKFIVTK